MNTSQNNPTPWVVLAVIIMSAMLVLGILLGGGELLNPARAQMEAEHLATAGALEADATRAAYAATETPRVAALEIQVTQTAQVVQATQVPLSLTATQVAADAALADIAREATRSAIYGQQQNDAYLAAATQTAVALQAIAAQQQAEAEKNSQTLQAVLQLLVAVGVLAISASLVYYLVSRARVTAAGSSVLRLGDGRTRTPTVYINTSRSSHKPGTSPAAVQVNMQKRKNGNGKLPLAS